MYKLIQGNQTSFIEQLNKYAEADIINFAFSNDGAKYVALIKITDEVKASMDKASASKLAAEKAALIKTKAEAKAKADKLAALERKIAELK